MQETIDKTNNKSNINQIFSDIDQSLAKAIADESFENAVEIAKSVIQLLGFEKDSINQKLVRFEKLQNTSNDSWTHKAPGYTDRKASYELASDNNKNIDFKIYWVKKSSKRIIANLVALTPNFEDEEDIYIKKNIGIDFVVPSEADRLIIILSKNYKIRTLELHKNLSNTQKKIFEKWVQDFDYSNKAQFHQILWDSFDIQPLNKEFYKEIASLFAEQVQHLVINKILDDEHAKQFTTRLIGRLIFCWFLRRKNIIAEEFQYFETANKDATQYYHEKLERLFFEVLNTPLGDRETVRYSSSKQQTRLISEKKPQKQLFEIDQQTPFLNGGLFDPKESDLYAQNKITFPQDYFQRFINGFLDKYNFTTDESTSDFQQVAIDPEMLGRIFENLLAEQSDDTGAQARKSKGAFYTPREIVDYMCKESLRQYLSTKLGDDSRKEQILSLLLDKKEHNFDYKNDSADLKPYKTTLVQALDDLKLLDPACGSGAFPIGMLQVILATYVRLDRRYESYRTKKQIIQENIYGVDIEPTAVEIARLRTWLSLIVDVELKPNSSNCGVDPLPNLDFKFVCANSLIPLAPNGQLSLLDDAELEKTIKSIRDDYFSSTSTKQKKNLQKQYEDLISENLLYHNGNGMSERQKQLRTYHPFDSDNVSQFFDSHFIFGVDGFDIVIGNPPYLDFRKISPLTKKNTSQYTLNEDSPRPNLYMYFAELGISNLRNNGVLTFINPSHFLSSDNGFGLRKFLLNSGRIVFINDISNIKVFDASTYPCVWMFVNHKLQDYEINVNKLKDLESLFIKGFEVNVSSIYTSKNLAILTNQTAKLTSSIEVDHKKLKDFCNICWGTSQSGYGKLKIKTPTYDKLKSHEKNNYAPILQTSDVKRFHIKWKGEFIPKEIYTDNVKKKFSKEKLLIARVTKSLQCALDLEKRYVGKSSVLNDLKLPALYLMGILNSQLITYWYRINFDTTHLNGGYLRFDKPYLLQIPIAVGNEDIQKRIIEITEKLIHAYENNSGITYLAKLERTLNDYIYKLYEITDAERLIIEKSLSE